MVISQANSSASIAHGVVLIRIHELLKRTGLARSTVYALMARGDFPQPVRLGLRSVAWRTAQIDAWLASRETAGTGAFCTAKAGSKKENAPWQRRARNDYQQESPREGSHP